MRSIRPVTTFLVLALLAAIGCSGPAAAGARSALVIANAAYPDSEAVLPGPVPDGRALTETLKRSGFAVEAGENLSRDGMQAAIERFRKGVEPDGIALVFFSGYGIQVGRKNYLIPVDARIWSEADVIRDGIAVDEILGGLVQRQAGTRVLVLDASRRNPFERRFRSFSTGLAPVTATPGLLALSATAPGGVLNEAGVTRSPFVAELIRQIGIADQDAEQAFAACRDALAKKARGGPAPALVAQLDEPFSFDPDRPKAPRRAEAKEPDETAREQARQEQARQEQARQEQARQEQARKEQADRERAAEDQAARQKAAREQAAREQAAQDESARQQAVRDQNARDQAAQAQLAKDQLAKDQAARERDAARAAERAEADDLGSAEAKGTRAAFEDFLKRHPTGARAETARARIAALAPEAGRRPEDDGGRHAELDARIAKNPGDEAAFYERGQFFAQRGDSGAAIADFDQTIRLNPMNPEAYNNRCWMRALADDLKSALADCNQALKLRPGFADALDSRGLVNLKAGAFRAAVSDYDMVLRLDPGRGSALYGRGVARMRLGDKALGGRDLASALQLNPTLDKDFAEYGLR